MEIMTAPARLKPQEVAKPPAQSVGVFARAVAVTTLLEEEQQMRQTEPSQDRPCKPCSHSCV